MLINISHNIFIGGVIFTFSMSTNNITEDSHLNVRLHRTAIILTTARNIVFINKVVQNNIDFLSHILFGREHTWVQDNECSCRTQIKGTPPPPPPHTHYNHLSRKKHEAKRYTEWSSLNEAQVCGVRGLGSACTLQLMHLR